jgi:hypothetical protein
VNLQEPIVLGAVDGSVTVTFAARQREGATFSLHPESLEERSAVAYVYPAHEKAATPPFLAPGRSRASLASGHVIACWTDDESGRVFAQAFRADGAELGSPMAVSPEGMHVFGPPHVVAGDGGHAVVAFFVCTEDGFEVVAESLERGR